jgi:predicted O-methyltransferase YrrM
MAILAASATEGSHLEIGTSAGYSTLWLALSCEAKGVAHAIFEVSPEKA